MSVGWISPYGPTKRKLGEVCKSAQTLATTLSTIYIHGEKQAKKGISPMSDLKFPEWQEPYLEAMMETDRWKLPDRVNLAETALLSRLKTILSTSDRRTEKQAIEDALIGLTVLKGETAKIKSSESQPFGPN
jgi:hypothetical protein